MEGFPRSNIAAIKSGDSSLWLRWRRGRRPAAAFRRRRAEGPPGEVAAAFKQPRGGGRFVQLQQLLQIEQITRKVSASFRDANP
jgi:hypothetical protein